MKPYQHQLETIQKLDEQFAQNKNKGLVVLPSGSGKTHNIAFHVARLKPKSFLYIVHQNDILVQTVGIFREICQLGNGDIGIINQQNKDYNKRYLFATIQTLRNDKNLLKIKKNIEYLVIDEYHHVAADSYVKIITKHFKPKYLVGLTATPYRLDKLDILKYVDGNIVNEIDLFEGIERKILTPFHYVGLWDNIDYTNIRWSGYRYNVGDLDRKLIIHKRDEAVLEEFTKRILPENRLTIGFCNSIEHVIRITEKFKKAGINAVAVTYKEKIHERQEILYNFKQGNYQVLFTRDILNEGVDFPECSAVMLLRPTISKTIFFQQIGRGLRNKEGKENVLVLDYVGNYHRAFKKRNWLKMFKKKDERTGEHTKPYYEYHPKIKIEFDEKVVEMMEIQERADRQWKEYSKQEVYEDYMNCCKKENKPYLRWKEYEICPYRKISTATLRNHYGGFKEFLEEIGIVDTTQIFPCPPLFHICSDKEKLIENYKKVKKKFNDEGLVNVRDPISNNPLGTYLNNPKNSRYGPEAYRRTWGSFDNFLKENPQFIHKDSINPIKYDEEKIREKIKILQKKLGREFISRGEWVKEYGRLGNYIHKGITFDAFRKKFGIPLYEIRCVICNEIYRSKYPIKKNPICNKISCGSRYSRIYNTEPKRKKLTEEKLKLMGKCRGCDNDCHIYRTTNNGIKRIRYCDKCATRRQK